MLINATKETIHRFSIGMFLTFFVAQTYITWVASRQSHLKSVSIYITDPDRSAVASPSGNSSQNEVHLTITKHRPGNKSIHLYSNGDITNVSTTSGLRIVKPSEPPLSKMGISTKLSKEIKNVHDKGKVRTSPLPTVTEHPAAAVFSINEILKQIQSEALAAKNIRKLEERMKAIAKPRPENCPPIPPNLHGRIRLNLTADQTLQRELQLTMRPGGRWRPINCLANHKVAIIIPYRDRPLQLQILLQHLHPLLQKQQLDYAIFVIELASPTEFNRGLLMNIGFEEAHRLEEYQCYIFHDVDLIPEDDRNLYTCPEISRPRHMSAAVSSFRYILPYKTIFGGVSAMTKGQFLEVNGFSNLFFGWGGEDDDLSFRLRYKGFHIVRYPIEIARYTMLRHRQETKNPQRMQLLKRGQQRPCVEGLTTLRYHLSRMEKRPLYTWVLVDVRVKDYLSVSLQV